jgi:polysaccharide biosynthesis transport protein
MAVRKGVAPASRGKAKPPGRRRSVVPTQVRPVVVAPVAARTDSLLVVLWRSRWAVLICLLLALDGGIAYLQNVTPLYTSTAKLYLDYAGVRLSNPYDPVGRPQTDKYLCTQAEIIKSRPILASVENGLAPRRLRTLTEADGPATFLQKNLAVEIGKKDEVISISLRSPYSVEAAEIVNRVVDVYLTSRSEHGLRDSAQVLKVLQDELQHVGDDLNQKRNELAAFRRDHMPLALGSDQGSGVAPSYLALQTACTQAQIKTTEAEKFRVAVRKLAWDPIGLRQYVQLRGNNGAFAATDQEKLSLETRLIELRRQKDSLLETLTANVPRVAAVSGEIQRIETKLKELDDRFVQAVTAAAEEQYEEAQGNEQRLAQLCRQQEGQVVLLNAEVAQYQRLREEEEQLKTVFQTHDQKVREFREVAGDQVGQWRMAVLEPALSAPLPSEPQPVRVMTLAMILGLLLGGGVAVTRDWLDQTLRSTDEISAVLRVPVLGVVPAMSRRKRMQERGRKVLLQPDSQEAEAFRTIRTAVLFGAAPEGAKTLLITSPAAGEGKSTLVSNLAIALATAGQKTLILDADFRKPMQHAIFGLDPRERCLSDVFAGTMTLAAAVQPTGIERLHVLSGGPHISNPAEVLNSQPFAQLLTCLTEAYDRVVVDAPPVTVVTDAQILGALCDATVLVLKADRSARTVALHAVDALQSVGARLLGVVVNEVRKNGSRYGYYRHRRYYGSEAKRHRAASSKNSIPVEPLHVGTTDGDSGTLPVKMTSGGA